MTEQKNEADKKKDKPYKPSKITVWKIRITEFIEFLTYDIWRIDSDTLSSKKSRLYDAIKTVILTVRNTGELNLSSNAASLTYRTVLSIVPMLAVLFAIARGFGLEKFLKSGLFSYFEGQNELLQKAFGIIDDSLKYAQGGIFAGIGVVLLLYTVFTLFQDIEINFNRIWQIKKGRSIQRRAIDYLALILLLPVMIILNSGLSFMISSSTLYFDKYSYILNPLVTQVLNFLPFFITIFVLTLLYKFMPNTKVKFINALIAAIIIGTIYQFFQMLYLNGQIWITKYNAIYGTFAAIPLLLLWLQVSWYLILIGVTLSFSAQNVRKFSFEKETRNISRQYFDFFTLLITSVIVKRFAEQHPPLTPDEISEECKIPVRLTNQIINELEEMHIITPTPSPEDEKLKAYQPALDINLISIGFLAEKVDLHGSSDFLIDIKGKYRNHWRAFIKARSCMYENGSDTLLKDL